MHVRSAESREGAGMSVSYRVRFAGGFWKARFFSKYLAVEGEGRQLMYTVSRRIWRTVREIRDRDDGFVAQLAPRWWTANQIVVKDAKGAELDKVFVTGATMPSFLLRHQDKEPMAYTLEHAGGAGWNVTWRFTRGGNVVGEVKMHSLKRGEMDIAVADARDLLPALILSLSCDIYRFLRRR